MSETMNQANVEQSNDNDQSFRRFRGVRQPAEIYSDTANEAEIAIVVDMNQQIEAISADEIATNEKHDETINGFYEAAKHSVIDIHEHAERMHTVLSNQVQANISEAHARYVDRTEQIDALVDSQIAALEQQRTRAKKNEQLVQAGSIAESERMQQQADSLLASNLDAIKRVASEITGGQAHQAKLEQQRNNAIAEFNDLVIRKDIRETDLAATEKKLDMFKEKLSLQEERRDELFEEETKLKAKERSERETLARPQIDEFMLDWTPEDPAQDLPQGIVDTIKSIKNDVQSVELSRILGELDVCIEKQRHNARSIANLGDIITQTELQINTTTDEIQELTLRLTQLKAKLDGPLTDMSIDLQAHSADVVKVATIFKTILQGDTTQAAKQSIPGPLHHVHDNMVAYKKAISPSRNEQTDWEPPIFTTNTFSALGDYLDDEPAPTLEGEQAMQQTIEQGSEQIRMAKTAGLMGTIAGRKLFKPGLKFELRDKVKENS
jgi:hypothetical protein